MAKENYILALSNQSASRQCSKCFGWGYYYHEYAALWGRAPQKTRCYRCKGTGKC